jgi:hypothetical protein
MGSPIQPDLAEMEIALKRYDALFRYLAYENTVYWTRSQFFLYANIGLLALTATRLPTDGKPPTFAGILILAAPIAVGLLMTVLWLVILRKAEKWIDHWERLCIELEPLAFADQKVWREMPEKGLKFLAKIVAGLFIVLWVAAGALLFSIAVSGVAGVGQQQPAPTSPPTIVVPEPQDKPLPRFVRPEWVIVYVTVVYSAFTFFQWWTLRRQAKSLEQQIKDARVANEGASKTAQNTLDAIERQATSMGEQTVLLRESVEAAKAGAEAARASADIAVGTAIPRLAIHEFEAASYGESVVTPEAFFRFPRLRITVKNHGRTPAFLKWWSLCFSCEELPEIPVYGGPGEGVVLRNIVVRAGEKYTLPVLEFMRTREFSSEDVQAILERNKLFTAYGYVCYGDVFGNPLWRFKFCYNVLNVFGGSQICDWWEGFAPPAYFGIDHARQGV